LGAVSGKGRKWETKGVANFEIDGVWKGTCRGREISKKNYCRSRIQDKHKSERRVKITK